MDKDLALFLAILILVLLLALFVVSFILNKRTPVPEGCENLLINSENCAACSQKENCSLNNKKENK